MRVNAILRTATISAVACLSMSLSVVAVFGQDVGAEVGGAGIFRAKNPVAKKPPKSTTTTTTTRPSTRPSTTRPKGPTLAERIEDLLEKGNESRDARKFTEAEEAYQGVLKLKPRDARAAYGLGNVYSDQQRWDDAESAYRDAVQWAPKDPDAYVALSVILVQPRAGGDNAKRFTDAESFARRSVQIDPKNAVGWDRLGVALETRGIRNSETEHSYRRAIEVDPQFAVAYAHLARLLNRAGRPGEAAGNYAKASELAKDPPTLNLIAESLQAEQLWAASEAPLKRALEMDPRNPTSLILMGRLLMVNRKYQEAEPYLRTATEVSPRAFLPFNLLGRAYLALDRLGEAEATYEKASEFVAQGDKKQLAGLFGFEGVGDGYLKAKQKQNAARVYQRALELDPGNTGIAQKLAKARAN